MIGKKMSCFIRKTISIRKKWGSHRQHAIGVYLGYMGCVLIKGHEMLV